MFWYGTPRGLVDQVMLGRGFPHATQTSDNLVPPWTLVSPGFPSNNGASPEKIIDGVNGISLLVDSILDM